MPDYVITASIYVDNVPNEEAATQAVECANNAATTSGNDYVFIRLPDNNPQLWERVDHPQEEGDEE